MSFPRVSGGNPEYFLALEYAPNEAMKSYYVYILASDRNGTLYIGVTNDLRRGIYEHKHGLVEGFTKKHNVKILVYYEKTEDVQSALAREKQLKGWNRKWKLRIIEKNNPEWNDLYDVIIEGNA